MMDTLLFITFFGLTVAIQVSHLNNSRHFTFYFYTNYSNHLQDNTNVQSFRNLSNSTFPTSSPTMQPALKMSWMIEGTEAVFTVPEIDENPLIIVPYNISNRDFDVKLWESDCETPLNSSLAFVKETGVVSSGGGFKNVEAYIDFNITRLNTGETGQQWIHSSETKGNYTFCICGFLFLDLEDERNIINLLTNQMTLSYDVSGPISFGEKEEDDGQNDDYKSDDEQSDGGGENSGSIVQVTREEITATQISADFDDRIIVYQCDNEKNVISQPGPITQGDALIICIEVKPDDDTPLEISTINELNVLQEGQSGQSVIKYDNTMHGDLTEYDSNSCSTGVCQIKFQVFARFFEAESPPDLKIEGSTSFIFSEQRNLRGSKMDGSLQTYRMNQESGDQESGEFFLTIKIIGTGDSYYGDYGDYYYYSTVRSSTNRRGVMLPIILTFIFSVLL